MLEETQGFLVWLNIHVLGGTIINVCDAFRAENEDEAKNFALNTFIQGSGAVVYGEALIVLDALCAVCVNYIESIDLSLPENARWLESVTLFEQMLDEQDARQESDGSGSATS